MNKTGKILPLVISMSLHVAMRLSESSFTMNEVKGLIGRDSSLTLRMTVVGQPPE